MILAALIAVVGMGAKSGSGFTVKNGPYRELSRHNNSKQPVVLTPDIHKTIRVSQKRYTSLSCQNSEISTLFWYFIVGVNSHICSPPKPSPKSQISDGI